MHQGAPAVRTCSTQRVTAQPSTPCIPVLCPCKSGHHPRTHVPLPPPPGPAGGQPGGLTRQEHFPPGALLAHENQLPQPLGPRPGPAALKQLSGLGSGGPGGGREAEEQRSPSGCSSVQGQTPERWVRRGAQGRAAQGATAQPRGSRPSSCPPSFHPALAPSRGAVDTAGGLESGGSREPRGLFLQTPTGPVGPRYLLHSGEYCALGIKRTPGPKVGHIAKVTLIHSYRSILTTHCMPGTRLGLS